MARTVRGGRLETRTQRLKLEVRKACYWNVTAKQGLHLGYRRLDNINGTWVARTYQGESGKYKHKAFAQADDYSDADGDEVLTYFQAAQRIAGVAPPVRHSSAYSVQDAIDSYLGYIEKHRKSIADARSRLTAYVAAYPYFAARPVSSLTPADFEAWSKWAYTHDPRAKAPKRKEKQEMPAAERERRRKATLNKVVTYLRAALDQAYDARHVETREAWARLRKFKGTDSARIARLSIEEARRLTNAAPPDFRRLLELALLTGCRYGELIAFQARDFDAISGTLLVAQSKAGKSRRVPLTDEGRRLLEELTADKKPDDIVLTKADGTAWRPNDQFERIRATCTAAKISPPINFHAIRHTTASLLVEKGAHLAFVAEVLGHSDTRMVSKHYAHLATNLVHDEIRAKLPSFNVKVDGKVRKLRP
jgi:integrase